MRAMPFLLMFAVLVMHLVTTWINVVQKMIGENKKEVDNSFITWFDF